MRPDRLGPYELGEPLGKGGMGAVYRATHGETGEAVAVKVLNPRLAVAEGFRDRFESEVESLKALRHAGIVRLYGYGEEEGTLFYAMELVDGPSLEDELRNGRRFDWRETTQIAMQVCRALKHAHDHGVIHRDLKPANILLTPNGQPKLADFGIARVFGSTGVTIAGGVLGTADYMSPEQAAGKPVNARCDQYCLGGVMYALLAGRPPFRSGDLAGMLQLQRFAIPEPIRRFAPDTPVDLERIIAKMLEKEPSERFPNTQVVARRLEAMSQALAQVAADDFQVYQTGAIPTPEPAEDGGESGLAFAVTRDAAEMTPPAPAGDEGLATPSGGGSVTSYIHVEPEAGPDGVSSWSAILGQATVLALAIGVLGGIAWWVARPPSADGLYQRVGRSAEEGDASVAALDAVAEFGRRFPDDPRGAEVAEWGKSLRLEQLRRKMQLTRLGGLRETERSAEESLLQRAARIAAEDRELGAEAFEGLAELIRTGKRSPRAFALADLAVAEARRLRATARAERTQLAEYCLEKLAAARKRIEKDPEGAAAVASAVVELLPAAEETHAALNEAQQILSETEAADSAQ